jgi:hypothetical protein
LAASAQAQTLAFKPQRIVMDARVGSSSLDLTNSGKQVESYRVELVDMIYQDDGKVVPATKTPAGFPSAKELIRFSPNQIRLEPGESQTVRILLKSPQLADGEYRVHAVLRQLPNVSKVKEPAKGNTVAGVIGVEQSVAIAVIIRRGATSATGTIAGMKIVDGKPGQLDLSLSRVGNRSLYTNLFIKNKAGAVVHEIKGVAVPVPNKTRRLLLGLTDKATPAALRGGGYTIEMVDHDTGAVIDKKPVK